MNKLTLKDVVFSGKRALMRVDFNVPIKDGVITDDTRIKAALPSIKYVIEQGGSVILMSHLGRPKGEKNPEFSLKPVADYLAGLIPNKVIMAGDVVGPEVKVLAEALQPGEILMLENTRFYKEEEGKGCTTEQQDIFAKNLAELGDVYVNDAFGTAHRAHASTAVICKFMKTNVAGFLMEKELEYLIGAIEAPERPFVAIVGGAKVSGKLEVLESLIRKVDTILIGGGMAYTFLKAMGFGIGNSLLEEDLIETAVKIMDKAKTAGVKLLLPLDNIAADKFDAEAATQLVGQEIPDGWLALDIGPETIKAYVAEIVNAKTVVWNGPMGCFEMEKFASGTTEVCKAVAAADCVSIIGGGDSVSAVNKSGLADRMSHISTGGGASLELLEGKQLPGVVALNDRVAGCGCGCGSCS